MNQSFSVVLHSFSNLMRGFFSKAHSSKADLTKSDERREWERGKAGGGNGPLMAFKLCNRIFDFEWHSELIRLTILLYADTEFCVFCFGSDKTCWLCDIRIVYSRQAFSPTLFFLSFLLFILIIFIVAIFTHCQIKKTSLDARGRASMSFE